MTCGTGRSSGIVTALALGIVSAGAAQSAQAAERASASTEPSIVELQRQINALQAQLNALESKQRLGFDQRDVDAAIETMLQDADRRSQFLQTDTGVEQLTAGHERGKFFIRDPEGNFSFSPSLQVQLRNVTTWRDTPGSDSIENGFEIRRAKFGFEGHIFTRDLTYKFVWATNRSGGSVYLEDVIVAYKLADTLSLFGGQFKDPVHHEELVSSTRQLTVERSLVNELLGGGILDRVQGVGLGYRSGPINATFAVHDGANSDSTTFRDSPANTTDYGVGGRLEYTVFGNNRNYNDFTARKNREGMLVVGIGGDATGAADANLYIYTLDAQWENTAGTGVYVALLGMTTDAHGNGRTTDWGALAQIGQMLSDKWEAFGRVGYIRLDDNAPWDKIWELTAGLNYYLFDHNAKLTLDAVYLPNGAPADTGLGYLNSGRDDQVVIRAQFQLSL